MVVKATDRVQRGLNFAIIDWWSKNTTYYIRWCYDKC
jgi:hypothetical protein